MSQTPPSDSTPPEEPGFFDSLKQKLGEGQVRSGVRDIADLFTAINRNDIAAVTSMVTDKGQSLDICNLIGVGALHQAVGRGHIEMVEAMLDLGASPDFLAGMPDKIAPLDVAIEKGHAGILRLLVAHGADPSRLSPAGTSYLQQAVRKNNPEMIRLLLALGADPVVDGTKSLVPLETAVMRRLHGATEALLQDPRIQAVAFSGPSPFSPELLAEKNDPELTKIFLKAGMPVNYRDARGVTMLHVAAYVGNEGQVEQLIKAGADVVRAKTAEGNTPLHALAGGDLEEAEIIGRLLIEAGAEVDARNRYGETALHLALNAPPPKTALAFLLLSHVNDVNAVTNAGDFPLHSAVVKGAGIEMVRAMVARGCDLDQAHLRTGVTALHAAVSHGQVPLVEFLLKSGADPKRRDAKGQTPLMLARLHGSQNMIEALEQRVTAHREEKLRRAGRGKTP